MNKPVFRTTYEIVGDGLPVLAEHRAKSIEAQSAARVLCEKYGAEMYGPTHDGGIRSLVLPGDARPLPGCKTRVQSDGMIEYTPRMNVKAGIALFNEFRDVLHAPTADSLARSLGYRMADAPMDGYKIYWPTFYDFGPTGGSAFLHLPRQEGDGFVCDPAMLAERPESTLMLAMEAHNAAARANRQVAA